VRTVEANLTRIYRKLDLHNRAELAARWAQPAEHSD
jgi:DNA-binding CsgD family transcriptional regulator